MPDDKPPPSPLRLACLCAAWCRTCDDYGPVLQRVAAELNAGASPEMPPTPRWVDIEDEAALLGDVDIETFPTVLVGDGTHLLFAGPLTPHADTLRRLLRSLQVARNPDKTASAEMRALARRLGLCA